MSYILNSRKLKAHIGGQSLISVGEELGISPSHLSRLKNGQRNAGKETADKLLAYCEAKKLSPLYFFDIDGERPIHPKRLEALLMEVEETGHCPLPREYQKYCAEYANECVSCMQAYLREEHRHDDETRKST